MTDWNEKTIRSQLAEAAKKLHVRMPQAQLLLCQDRFLARLASLDDGKRFVWKGGSLVLRRYSKMEIPRFTVDIDLLARGITIPQVEPVLKRAMEVDLGDGFQFHGISKTEMERDTPYGGDRYEIGWTLFGKQGPERLRIDVCAGDDVDPQTVSTQELFLLKDRQEVTLLVYPPEFIFAEKLETMVRFKTGNTRLKDFIDMWTLIQLPIDPKKTQQAIQRCFNRRKTPLDKNLQRAILADKSLSEILENARKKRFPEMQIPTIETIFAEIGRFLEIV